MLSSQSRTDVMRPSKCSTSINFVIAKSHPNSKLSLFKQRIKTKMCCFFLVIRSLFNDSKIETGNDANLKFMLPSVSHHHRFATSLTYFMCNGYLNTQMKCIQTNEYNILSFNETKSRRERNELRTTPNEWV